jgi:hypothetical protein
MIDPDELLKDIRAAVDELNATEKADDQDCRMALAQVLTCTSVLTTRFQVLDEWLSKGGFLPDEWRNAF